VDVLVNDAALAYYAPVVDLPASRWMRAFAVNVHGPFMLARAALPAMIARHSGAIVNISAISAMGPGRGPYRTAGGARPTGNALPGGVLYGVTKAALERFTQGLAEEVYEHGVSVTCVSPSLAVPTPGTIFHGLVTNADDPHAEPPSMIAQAALLLASEPLDRVTGRVAYSQQLLREFGWISGGRGPGIDEPGSGYSQI
jgi:NAD(P)-dependent dehydrogenase (short-subunit alcohol dehydrogenase family)